MSEPSKSVAELFRQAPEPRDRWDQGIFEQRVREIAGYDPRAMLLAMFDVLDEWFTHEDFAGCLFMHACAEFPDRRDPIHRAAAAHYAVSMESVAQVAMIPEPETFAVQWSLLLEGAVIHRVVTGDDHAARTAKSIAELLLERASG